MVLDWLRWFLAGVICCLAIRNVWPQTAQALQLPLSYPGATADSGRARKPPLAELSATDQELHPGDRVEGLGNFGKPTGEFGTVEQANEDDVIVKWDDDGRMGLHQPWLKKVWTHKVAARVL
jgi:hypothetical protein